MMPEQFLPCPGCGGEPFVDQHLDDPHRYLECNECTCRAEDRDWQRRTPGPATKAILGFLAKELEYVSSRFHGTKVPEGAGYGLRTDIPTDDIKAFLSEWPEPITKGGA